MPVDTIFRIDSNMIAILRSVCVCLSILTMAPLYTTVPSALATLEPSPLAEFLRDASLSTLSLISGYLLLHSIERHRLNGVLRKRSGSVFLPIVTWNALYFMIFAGLGWLNLRPFFDDPLQLLDMAIGLSGPTLNPPLAYIMDLFVSAVLVALLWPVIRKIPAVVIAAAYMSAVTDVLAPAVLHPNILLFVMLGTILRAYRFRLHHIGSLRYSAPIALVSILGALAVMFGVPVHNSIELRIIEILEQTAAVVGFLFIALQMSRVGLTKTAKGLTPYLAVAFLGQAILAPLVAAASAQGGLPLSSAALAVAVLMTSFIMAVVIDRLLRSLPPWCTTIIAGKSAPLAPAPAPRSPNQTSDAKPPQQHS